MTEVLTDVELDLIFYIERFHSTNGVAPTDAQLNQRFDLTPEILANFKNNELVQKSFKARGIIYPTAADRFTPEQMHAAEVMTNIVDRRSDEKRLRDLGITTRQWSQWLLDDDFADYLTARTEKLLAHSTFELHKGLLKGVRNGNIAAVKTAYEVTGRYRPDQDQQVDVGRLLHTFIEVLQRYVKDPIVMRAIAMDLSSIAQAETLSTSLTNQVMAGAQNFRSRTIAGQLEPMPELSDE